MDLLSFVIFSAIYIMIIRFGLAIENEFNLFLMIGIFVFGGAVGYFVGSYGLGFVGAIILSLVFW